MGAHVRTVALTGSDQAVRATASIYKGFTIYETAGATAEVLIYDDPDSANGTLLDVITLAADESARELYPSGVWAEFGIFVKVISGAVAGSIRIG